MTAALRLIQRQSDDQQSVASFITGRPEGTQRVYGGEIQAMAKDRRLSVGSTYERFKRLCKKAGLPSQVSPHSLRHFFACEADAAGASVEAIRQSLGHSGLGTTQRYLQRIHRGINEAFAKTKLPKLSEVL
jgi:site-specific recombinase XerD